MTNIHKWNYKKYFRKNAYSWKGTNLACKRMKDAVSEIKKIAKKDDVLASEGIIHLFGKFSSTFEHIDSSSGRLGTGVYNTIQKLLPILIKAKVEPKIREKWLEQLWQSMEEDGLGFLDPLPEVWGELCQNEILAAKYANETKFIIRKIWLEDNSGYHFGIYCHLSCLLKTRKYDELLYIIEKAPYTSWGYREFGVTALTEQGKIDEALAYAEKSIGLNDNYNLMADTCEKILIMTNRVEEAYSKYGISANQSNTGISTFRKIAKKYPGKDKKEILNDLMESEPGNIGKWFATAKTIGFLDLAAEIAENNLCNHNTLTKAAKDFLETNPKFSWRVAFACLKLLAKDLAYELTAFEVHHALDVFIAAAKVLDNLEQSLKKLEGVLIDVNTFAGNIIRVRVETENKMVGRI